MSLELQWRRERVRSLGQLNYSETPEVETSKPVGDEERASMRDKMPVEGQEGWTRAHMTVVLQMAKALTRLPAT
jgi:hypothetical protein